ncbi:MAG: hypothetical protein BAJALOKI3v1_40035 [Promethearchaeota archaeon]|jgi:hypothetical protein|nr:MAG: hypothetical protein BAJALOKI3v1_40035 [Candidatus Lokiarchaeota archaeon]
MSKKINMENKETSKNEEYSLFVHWKQGEHLAYYLEKRDYDTKKAILDWDNNFRKSANKIRKLLGLFKDKNLKISLCSDHSIILAGDEKALEDAAKQNLVIKKYEKD